MRRPLPKYLLIAAALFSSAQAEAQHDLGVATGNWAGVNALYLNPASIADSRIRFEIDVFSLGMGADNSLGAISSKGGLIGAISNGNPTFSYSNNGSFSLLAPYAEVRGPGCIISINSKHSIALTTGISGINQFNNFNQSLYRTITDPNYDLTGDIDITSSKFNYTAQIWSQVGLSYGGVVFDDGRNELRVGATVRYLGGFGYVALKGNNLDAHFKAGNDSFYASNSDIEYASNIFSTRTALLNGFSNNSILSEFFNANAGKGVGGDIGVIYDYIPDPDRKRYEMDGKKNVVDGSENHYLVRVSASVVNIGAITYKAGSNYNANVSGNGYVTGNGLINNVSNYTDFRNYMVAQGFRADTNHTSTKLYMPTTLLLGADYHAYKQFYANITFAGNLANREQYGNSFYSQLTLTPRFDTRMLSVGLPITYSMLSHTMKLGLGVRAAGFFIGSDDMLALFASHQYGFNLYVGGCIPLYKMKIKDRDGDHVSDRKDKCPEDYGPWENRGCPTGKDSNKDSEAKQKTAKQKNTDQDE